ncbi:MAG: YlmH/Sll1252 family protein [Clostridia bacterium]
MDTQYFALMRIQEDAELLSRRFAELAQRAEQMEHACFTGFLSPPEAEWAQNAGKKQGVSVRLNGGYEDAERQMACFVPAEEETPAFPLSALKLTWPHQTAPTHRDVLGSVMALGLKRQCIGDIVMGEGCAYLFAESAMSSHIADMLLSAGRTHLQVEISEELPLITPAEGTEVRDTVLTTRLDAVLAAGFGLSRAKAAELIAAGNVKLRHLPTERSDARVTQGDAISARGYGRLVLTQVGEPTKKGRLPLILTRYGEKRGR